MRNKKLLSTAIATALAVSTMAMPVMAADNGELNVPVTTKSAVIRVQVPTTMSIAVNQFEMGDSGSQIYSTDFTMDNKSEIPVKVGVKSTATLKATTKLLGTKAAAGSSTTEGEAWMAVAAKTAASSYADGSASTVADLAESNKNVKTFVQGEGADATKGTAEQTFYLGKSSAMAYKLLNANEDASKINYAQFYELKEKPGLDADGLADLIAENDVYVATKAAENGLALTKVAKGKTHAFASGEVYYTAAEDATAKASIDASKLYVYGDGTVDATGTAGFRYIGKLSEKQETWTKADITDVKIEYSITGVTATKYDEVDDDCTYGLYKETPKNVAPSVAAADKTKTLTAGTAVTIPVNLGSGTAKATEVTSVKWKEQNKELLNVGGMATYSNGVVTITQASVDYLLGTASYTPATMVIKFDDSAPTSVEVTLSK